MALYAAISFYGIHSFVSINLLFPSLFLLPFLDGFPALSIYQSGLFGSYELKLDKRSFRMTVMKELDEPASKDLNGVICCNAIPNLVRRNKVEGYDRHGDKIECVDELCG